MKHIMQNKREAGFSLMETMVCILVLLPVMGAALTLFSTGAKQQGSEQGSVAANQEARAGLEMMTRELAQAGSHGDRLSTKTSDSIGANPTSIQTVNVDSAAGMTAGDFVDIELGTSTEELVQLTAVTPSSISGVFKKSHPSNSLVCLFAYPHAAGVVPPAGMPPNTSWMVNTIKFFGNINSDSTLEYIEYNYDHTNARITRSATPITQATKNPAIPLINNISSGSAQFILNTDGMGVVTSVNIAMRVQNTYLEDSQQYQETELSSRILLPSASAASGLAYERLIYQGVDRLPQTPPQVVAWASETSY